MQIRRGTLRMAEEIAKIEAEPVRSQASFENGVRVVSYQRTFRLTTTAGETIDLTCVAENAAALQIQEIEQLPPVKQATRRLKNWLGRQRKISQEEAAYLNTKYE